MEKIKIATQDIFLGEEPKKNKTKEAQEELNGYDKLVILKIFVELETAEMYLTEVRKELRQWIDNKGISLNISQEKK